MALKIGMHAGPQDCSYEDLKRLWHMADELGVLLGLRLGPLL